MDTKPDEGADDVGTRPTLEHLEQELQKNFGLSEEAARVTAEDELRETEPAPASYEVELERIRRANGETT